MRIFYDGFGKWVHDITKPSYLSNCGEYEFTLIKHDELVLKRFGSVQIACLQHADNQNIKLMISDIYGTFETVVIHDHTEIQFTPSGYRLKIIDDDNHTPSIDLKSLSYESKSLSVINRAAHEFWSVVNPEDKTTYPKSLDVEKWLIAHGINSNLAHRLPVILKPDWAK